MRDVDIFTKLLALERPWAVDGVVVDSNDESIRVALRHRSNSRFRCPKCGAVLPLHGHAAARTWRRTTNSVRQSTLRHSSDVSNYLMT